MRVAMIVLVSVLFSSGTIGGWAFGICLGLLVIKPAIEIGERVEGEIRKEWKAKS